MERQTGNEPATIDSMEHCLCHDGRFTRADADSWNARMVNDDGTMGGHWSVAQTTTIAQNMGVSFDHITEYTWNTAGVIISTASVVR